MKKKLPNNIGGYSSDSLFLKMEHKEFVEWCGGQLAIALFKGEFRQELYHIIPMAHARGIKSQLEEE